MPTQIAVIGAGVTGLSAALRLQELAQAPGSGFDIQVTIVARDFPAPAETIFLDREANINYTSPWAGAHNRWVLWVPDGSAAAAVAERDHGFALATYRHMKATHARWPEAGITFCQGVELLDVPGPEYTRLADRAVQQDLGFHDADLGLGFKVVKAAAAAAAAAAASAATAAETTATAKAAATAAAAAAAAVAAAVAATPAATPAIAEVAATTAAATETTAQAAATAEEAAKATATATAEVAAASGQQTAIAGVRFPPGVTWACAYRTWCVNPMVYCGFLLRRFVAAGGRLARRTLRSPAELLAGPAPFALVVNCSGYGFGGDPHMFVTRGQTCLVRNPCAATVTRQFADGTWSFSVPRFFDGGTVVGGTKDVDNWDPAPSPAVRTRLLANFAVTYPPVLLPAQAGTAGAADEADDVSARFDVIADVVGRRPTRRGGMRLEAESVAVVADAHGPATTKTIVHAYGVGGRGFEISWGVAGAVVDLVKASLD